MTVLDCWTPAEIEAALARAVAGSGFSLAELQRQAARGRFDTEVARLAWEVVGPLLEGPRA